MLVGSFFGASLRYRSMIAFSIDLTLCHDGSGYYRYPVSVPYRKNNVSDPVEPRNLWLDRAETNRLAFMRPYYKLSRAARSKPLVLLTAFSPRAKPYSSARL